MPGVDLVAPAVDAAAQALARLHPLLAPESNGLRVLKAEGQIDDATLMLGGPWFVTGEVIHGEKRGRELGFPTANIRLDPACGLKHGVYAVRVGLDGKRYDGVANFGRRPMFDVGTVLGNLAAGDTRTVDVHIRALRKKLGDDAIETVVGAGYRLRDDG